MKTRVKFYLMVLSVIMVAGCKSSGDKAGNASGGDDAGTTFAVCVWDKTALKETPEEKGKWLASISLGEKCTYLDKTIEDNTGSKIVKYVKIRLLDGKEGWAQNDLVILDSRPATFTQNAEIYSRPDLLTKTGKSFSKMDIVAVKSVQNDFVEVTGKRRDGKWIESGWVKPANLTYTDVDIAVAKFACSALAIADMTKRTDAIKEIVMNSDLSGSVFIDELSEMTLEEDEDIIAEEETSEAENL